MQMQFLKLLYAVDTKAFSARQIVRLNYITSHPPFAKYREKKITKHNKLCQQCLHWAGPTETLLGWGIFQIIQLLIALKF